MGKLAIVGAFLPAAAIIAWGLGCTPQGIYAISGANYDPSQGPAIIPTQPPQDFSSLNPSPGPIIAPFVGSLSGAPAVASLTFSAAASGSQVSVTYTGIPQQGGSALSPTFHYVPWIQDTNGRYFNLATMNPGNEVTPDGNGNFTPPANGAGNTGFVLPTGIPAAFMLSCETTTAVATPSGLKFIAVPFNGTLATNALAAAAATGGAGAPATVTLSEPTNPGGKMTGSLVGFNEAFEISSLNLPLLSYDPSGFLNTPFAYVAWVTDKNGQRHTGGQFGYVNTTPLGATQPYLNAVRGWMLSQRITFPAPDNQPIVLGDQCLVQVSLEPIANAHGTTPVGPFLVSGKLTVNTTVKVPPLFLRLGPGAR